MGSPPIRGESITLYVKKYGLEFTVTELQRIKKEFKLAYDYKIVWNRYDARERLGAIYMHALVKNEERAAIILL